MPKYVAFLRAINVGGHTVKMDQLRTLFAGLGFSNVETFIASGNVIFDSSSKSARALEKKIESCLLKTLGYEVLTYVRSIAELTHVATHQAFPSSDLTRNTDSVHIGFMSAEPDSRAKQKLLDLASESNQFHVNGREFYWLRRTSFSDSDITGVMLAKALGMPATVRNSTTVKKIAAKYS